MKQQIQAAKRPASTGQVTQQRYPPREVPPRFMQQQAHKQQQKSQGEADYSTWTDSDNSWDKLIVDESDPDAWPSIAETRPTAPCDVSSSTSPTPDATDSDAASTASGSAGSADDGATAAATPAASISGSVIISSSSLGDQAPGPSDQRCPNARPASAGPPGPNPAEPNSVAPCSELDGDSDGDAGHKRSNAAAGEAKSPSIPTAMKTNNQNDSSTCSSSSCTTTTLSSCFSSLSCVNSPVARWPPVRMGLLGGGESSLNNAGSSWGTPPSNASQGWTGVGTGAAGGAAAAQGQWGGVNNNGGGVSGAGANVNVNANASRSVGGNANATVGTNSTQGTNQSKSQSTWAQAAGKGLNIASGESAAQQQQQQQSSNVCASSSVSKRVSDENDLRQAVTSHDGWGQQSSVNQDSSWDVAGSPVPSPKENNGTTVWKSNLSNGTEIWENNLRNGGKTLAPNAPASNPAWTHTPMSNVGGTWGEDDDNTNMWTGVPNNPPNNNSWGNNGTSVWDVNLKEKKFPTGPTGPTGSTGSTGLTGQGTGNAASTGWGDGASGGVNGVDNGTSAWTAVSTAQAQKAEMKPWSSPGVKELKMSGWEEPSPPTARRGVPNCDDGTAVWGNPHNQGKVCYWKNMPSTNSAKGCSSPVTSSSVPMSGPGMIRIPQQTSLMGSKDNGTGVWGKPQSLPRTVSHPARMSWGDGSPHESTGSCSWDEASTPTTPSMKAGPGGNNWGEATSPMAAQSWGAKPKIVVSGANWIDSSQIDTSTWGPTPAKQASKLNKHQLRLFFEAGYKKEEIENMLRNSSSHLDDSLNDNQVGVGRDACHSDLDGYTSINLCRSKMRDMDMPMDPSPQFGQGSVSSPSVFANPIFANASGVPNNQQLPYKPQNSGMNNAVNLLSNSALMSQAANMGNVGMSNLSPALVQKFLQHQQQQQQQQQVQQQQQQQFQNMNQNAIGGAQGRLGQQSIPSPAQLRLLVQQIQMAVQAGHLNPQILNQPLAPQTLILLNQLLQQIKQLQQLLAHQHLAKGNANTALQISVQITKTKQQISNLQNQIAAQQAVYVKTHPSQPINPHVQPPIGQNNPQHNVQQHHNTNELFKTGIDALGGLSNDIRDLALKDQPQSRLRTQWKLPPLEKEKEMEGGQMVGGDFSRAPGSVSKTLPQSHSSPNLNPVLSQVDSTWSSLSRSQSDSGWPDSAASGESSLNGSLGDKENQWPGALSDLVPEFEPGKPWKGTSGMKNIEDDPHITPGSVARSPLSLNTIKDSDLFALHDTGLTKPSPVSSANDSSFMPLGLSNTWSYNTSTSTSSTSSAQFSGEFGKPSGWAGKATHPPSTLTTELWGAPMPKTRGPPPGLGNHTKPSERASAGPVSTGGSAWNSSTGAGHLAISRHNWTGENRSSSLTGWDRHSISTWLMLRNLTPQIDGSTLKTLCLQHGPLQAFHLYLNQGIALVRYSSHEEAEKAQKALNSCVLGNTTILADFANENDMQQFLQQSGTAPIVASAATQPTAVTNPPNTVNTSWGPGTTSSASASYRVSYGHFGNPAAKQSTDTAQWNGAPAASLGMTTSQLWPLQAGNMWSGAALTSDADPHRATPSSLNSYLPEDLLSSENA